MSISLDAPPSGSISKSDDLSSLPRWRRWLSTLNGHPVVVIEIEILEAKNEIEQIKSDNARLAELNAKIVALWPSSNSSLAPLQSTNNDLLS